jgi:hypothetical protein
MKNSELSPEARKLKKEYERNWRQKNAARIKQYHAAWMQKNPDKARQCQVNYWERKAKQLNIEPIEQRINSLHKQGYSLRQIASALKINHMKVKRIIDTVTKL